jgi:hypothetical protein
MSTRAGRIRGALVVAVAVLAPWTTACSDDPSGPGTVTVTVEGSTPLGGAVLDIRGKVDAAESLHAGWSLLEPLSNQGSTPVYRLLVVQEEAGALSVSLSVPDVGADLPAVTVLQASGADDRRLPAVGGLDVRVKR